MCPVVNEVERIGVGEREAVTGGVAVSEESIEHEVLLGIVRSHAGLEGEAMIGVGGLHVDDARLPRGRHGELVVFEDEFDSEIGGEAGEGIIADDEAVADAVEVDGVAVGRADDGRRAIFADDVAADVGEVVDEPSGLRLRVGGQSRQGST